MISGLVKCSNLIFILSVFHSWIEHLTSRESRTFNFHDFRISEMFKPSFYFRTPHVCPSSSQQPFQNLLRSFKPTLGSNITFEIRKPTNSRPSFSTQMPTSIVYSLARATSGIVLAETRTTIKNLAVLIKTFARI